MAQIGSNLVGDYVNEEPEGMAGALYSFDALRTELAEQAETQWRPRRAPHQVVSTREGSMMAELSGIHDAISEVDQLRIYRFFLTAVHRNSVLAHRFDTQIIAFPERSAAMEAELAEVSGQLNDIILEVANYSPLKDAHASTLQAATFLWSTVWWLHSRVDVASYKFSLGDDPLMTLLLGREPESGDAVVGQMYQCAMKAELQYRKMLLLKGPESVSSLKPVADIAGGRVPMHMRGESHL